MSDKKQQQQIDYLEDERKKIWQKIVLLEEAVKKPEDYEIEARQASKKVSEYRNRSEEARNNAFQYLEDIKLKNEEIQKLRDDVERYKINIVDNNNLSNEALHLIEDAQSRVSLKEVSIQSAVANLESIFENHSSYIEKIKKLESVFASGDDNAAKIDSLYKSMVSRKREMDELYFDIFGYTEDDSSGNKTTIHGKKYELDESYNELEESMTSLSTEIENIKKQNVLDYQSFTDKKNSDYKTIINNWTQDYLQISTKIEELLPNALTAGLSHAYSKKKEDEIKESIKLSKSFNWAIGGLVGVSLIPFLVSLFSWSQHKPLTEVLYDMPRLVLSILPLYVPVLWVAYSANRKMNLSKRLIEEYAHKEVLSKTFEGLSKQISGIENKDISSELRVKLLYNILEVSSENPGKLISDYNKSDHPLMDALDKSVKLATAVEKVSKIPGLKKLSQIMDKKSEALLKEKDKKANEGLSDLENEEKDSMQAVI